jgi:hypothetical protein
VIERVGRVDESSHSSGLSTVGNRLRDFGNGMYSARKCRCTVSMNRKRKVDTYCETVIEDALRR